MHGPINIRFGGDVAAYISSVLVGVCMLHCSGIECFKGNRLCISWVKKNFDNIKMRGTNVTNLTVPLSFVMGRCFVRERLEIELQI